MPQKQIVHLHGGHQHTGKAFNEYHIVEEMRTDCSNQSGHHVQRELKTLIVRVRPRDREASHDNRTSKQVAPAHSLFVNIKLVLVEREDNAYGRDYVLS